MGRRGELRPLGRRPRVRLTAAPARPAQARSALRLWWLQLVLNLSWSLVFFGRRRADWGLVVIGALELAIVGTTPLASRASRVGAALLVPDGLWTASMLALNYRITQLNRTQQAS